MFNRSYENQVVYVVVVDEADKHYPVIPEDHEDNRAIALGECAVNAISVISVRNS